MSDSKNSGIFLLFPFQHILLIHWMLLCELAQGDFFLGYYFQNNEGKYAGYCYISSDISHDNVLLLQLHLLKIFSQNHFILSGNCCLFNAVFCCFFFLHNHKLISFWQLFIFQALPFLHKLLHSFCGNNTLSPLGCCVFLEYLHMN